MYVGHFIDDTWFFTILLSYEGKKEAENWVFLYNFRIYIEKSQYYDSKCHFCSHFQRFMTYELILHILINGALILMLILRLMSEIYQKIDFHCPQVTY